MGAREAVAATAPRRLICARSSGPTKPSQTSKLVTYISAFNPAAAARLAERLVAVADSLSEHAKRGRDAGEGRREMTIVWPYILRYRVDGDRVLILRIRHGARDEG